MSIFHWSQICFYLKGFLSFLLRNKSWCSCILLNQTATQLTAFKTVQRGLCLMENFHLIIYWHSKTLEIKTHIATFKLSSLFYVREASEVIDPAHWCHLKFGNITNSSLSHFHTVSSLPPWPSVEPHNTPGLSEPLPWPFQRLPRSPLAELWTHHHE